MKRADVLHADRSLGKLNVNLEIFEWVYLKMGKAL